MANTAVAAGGAASLPATTSNGRAFWAASNYYLEKNNDQIPSTQLSTSSSAFNLRLNYGGFVRGARLQVRSSGGVGGTVTPDNPFNVFTNLIFNNVGNTPVFNQTNGYESMLYNAYGRPWEGDPVLAYDYAQSINPSFTLRLAPEIRHTLSALGNTDARQQYRVQGNLNVQSLVTSGTISTAPTVTVTTFLDTWAQPDTNDLQNIPNQPYPDGAYAALNMRRNQSFSLNGAGSNNTVIATEAVGNLVRNVFLVVRDSNGARQDYLTDPLDWYLDTRIIAQYTPDTVQQYMQEFYGTGALSRPTGVYVFPRFFNPGTMTGQGWLETSTASGMKWTSATSGTATNTSGGTINMFVDEVVPLQAIPTELEDL